MKASSTCEPMSKRAKSSLLLSHPTWPRHQKGRFHAFDTQLSRLEGWKGFTREVHGWLPPSQPRPLARAATWSARLFRALVRGDFGFAYLTHVLGGMALDRPPRPP